MIFIDKLAWIQIENRAILCARSKNKSVWYIPGGKRERNESDAEALVREIREELSVEIVRDSIKHFANFEAQADGHRPGTIVKMQCYFADYQGILEPSSEIEEMDWLNSSDLGQISLVDSIIFRELNLLNLIN